LALGCAVLHEPSVLFLDEPTSGVDPLSRRRFWDLIYELSGRGVTVFVTTHYMDEAEYCDRLALMHRGEVIAAGSPASLKETTMREELLEVRCDRPQLVQGEIESLPGVKEAALFGQSLHVGVAGSKGGVPAIRALLESRGCQGVRIEPIRPSLEDVFVSLVGARERGEPPPTEGRQ
jgi:ABC-2 type transport system ATP-binding protein